MKVITAYPVTIVNGSNRQRLNSTMYSNFDTANTDEIKKFQDWLDTAYPGWVPSGKLNKGKGYGSFGPSTQSAYQKYGKTYDAISGTATTPTPKAPTDAQKKGEKAGMVFDKTLGRYVQLRDTGVLQSLGNLFGKKGQVVDPGVTPMTDTYVPEQTTGMSKTTKVVLIGAGVLLLAVGIYYIAKPKTAK